MTISAFLSKLGGSVIECLSESWERSVPGEMPSRRTDSPSISEVGDRVAQLEFGLRVVAAAPCSERQSERTRTNTAAPGVETMETEVRKLFERYERVFNRALDGDTDMDEVASLYASDFIAATPAGVVTGKNDDLLKQVMAQGYERYRAIGTKGMRIRNVRLSPIDERHCVAHVAWSATYARKGQPGVVIDFDVHYLVQNLDGKPKVFGWVSGDEEELLRKHGII